jgi:hypothetical protein
MCISFFVYLQKFQTKEGMFDNKLVTFLLMFIVSVDVF